MSGDSEFTEVGFFSGSATVKQWESLRGWDKSALWRRQSWAELLRGQEAAAAA